MKILGINISNNGSICYLNKGKVEFYLESERISRKKMDYRVDVLYPLIKDKKVDAIALADSYWVLPEKKMLSTKDIEHIKRMFPDAKRLDFRQQHHLTHVAGAFYNSGFKEAACIVVDSNGSMLDGGMEIETIMHAKTGRRFYWKTLHKKYHTEDDIGIGKLFEEVAKHCGFHGDDAGKVMGLAPYGRCKTIDLYNMTEYTPRNDAAHTVQSMWEKRAIELVEIALSKSKCDNIVLSGGCFLNCVVNYKIKKHFPGINLYAEPIAHDGGTAVGAAYLAHYDPKIKDT